MPNVFLLEGLLGVVVAMLFILPFIRFLAAVITEFTDRLGLIVLIVSLSAFLVAILFTVPEGPFEEFGWGGLQAAARIVLICNLFLIFPHICFF